MDRAKQAQEREKFQSEVEQLSTRHKHLLITAATGCGKGKAVMRCIAASTSPKKWLIVVPEILQIENYKRDLGKHGYDKILAHKIADIICYASLHLWAGREVNLALNECHRLSDLRSDLVKSIQFDQIVSDSATVPDYVATKLKAVHPYHKYSLSLDEAIERGILPTPSVYLIPVSLDNTIRRNEVKIKNSIYRYTDYGMNQHYEKDFLYWDKRNAEEGYPEWIKTKLVRIGGARKKFLAGCKTQKAAELIKELDDKRMIVFCGSIDQCNELGGKLAVHSKRSKKINASLIDAFNNYTIDQIYLNRMGREGMNMEGIQAGVIVQLDGGNDEGLSFLQTTGRALRSDSPEVYIFYAVNTQDEKYLNRALQHIDQQYIKNY